MGWTQGTPKLYLFVYWTRIVYAVTIRKVDTGAICADDAEALCSEVGAHYFKVIDAESDLFLVLGMSF